MSDNPDVVKAFFECLDIIVQDFLRAFFLIPAEVLQAILSCAITALSMQERYSLVKSCMFLNTFLNALLVNAELETECEAVLNAYGRNIVHAVLVGIAGVAPRTVLPNLVELLTTLVVKRRQITKTWIGDVLYSTTFIPTKASDDAKKTFFESVVA